MGNPLTKIDSPVEGAEFTPCTHGALSGGKRGGMPREIVHYDAAGRPLLDEEGRPVVTLHYTITEAAAAIGVHRSTVLRMAERGEVRTELIGSRWYVPGPELARLTAEGLW